MRYRVIDLQGEILCESPDLEGARLALEWFKDQWIGGEIVEIAPY